MSDYLSDFAWLYLAGFGFFCAFNGKKYSHVKFYVPS